MAAYKASARSLDQGVGAVLDALDEHELADDTLVIFTTDHGLAFPGAKATLTDRGLGVLLIMRGAGWFPRRPRVGRARSRRSISTRRSASWPGWRRRRGRAGARCCRSSGARSTEVNDAIFGEITFHAAYEPQRAIRTRRYKYIRRFDNGHAGPVLPNIDDSPSKDLLLAHGLRRARAAGGGALRPRARSPRPRSDRDARSQLHAVADCEANDVARRVAPRGELAPRPALAVGRARDVACDRLGLDRIEHAMRRGSTSSERSGRRAAMSDAVNPLVERRPKRAGRGPSTAISSPSSSMPSLAAQKR